MGCEGNLIPGEFPDSGAIFMSNIGTKKECFRRKLFGLPIAKSNFVLHVKKGMALFLFEYERRQLYGVFRANSDGEINIEPHAFKSSGKHFPAQVRFTPVWNCSPLAEHEFQEAIRDNYFSGKKFNFGLSKDQVRRLIMLFHSKIIPKKHPARNSLRYGDHRKNQVKDRIKEDDYDLDICKFVGDEVKDVDDHVYLNEKLEEKVTSFEERAQKDYRDDFLTNYTAHTDFGDRGTRQAIFDHSLGGFRRVDDVDLHFMDDVNDGHEMKDEHDIEDGFRPIFTEYHGNHFGKDGETNNDAKFLKDGIASKNEEFMDDIRIKDEYQYIKTNDISFSHHKQSTSNSCDTTMITMPIPCASEVPDIPLGSSPYFAVEPIPSAVDNCPFYPCSKEIPTSLSMSKTLPHHSQNEGSFRSFSWYQEEPTSKYACKVLEPSHASKKLSSCDADLRPCKEDPILPNKLIRKPCQNKHLDGTDKRISVFARLTPADEKLDLDISVDQVMKMLEKVVSSPIKLTGKSILDFEQDDERKTASKFVDYEVMKVKMEPDDELWGPQSTQETRLVDFKRRHKKSSKNLDNKCKENSVGPAKYEESMSDMGAGEVSKRRKLVRPVFEKESTVEVVNADNIILTKAVKNSEKVTYENKPLKDDKNSIKAGEKSKKVDIGREIVNGGDKNSEKCLAEDVFVEGRNWKEQPQEICAVDAMITQDDDKMCGWIEW